MCKIFLDFNNASAVKLQTVGDVSRYYSSSVPSCVTTIILKKKTVQVLPLECD